MTPLKLILNIKLTIFQVVRRYKIETQKTSKSVAKRKLLHKFGKSEKDPTGPNKATTFVSEVSMYVSY